MRSHVEPGRVRFRGRGRRRAGAGGGKRLPGHCGWMPLLSGKTQRSAEGGGEGCPLPGGPGLSVPRPPRPHPPLLQKRQSWAQILLARAPARSSPGRYAPAYGDWSPELPGVIHALLLPLSPGIKLIRELAARGGCRKMSRGAVTKGGRKPSVAWEQGQKRGVCRSCPPPLSGSG